MEYLLEFQESSLEFHGVPWSSWSSRSSVYLNIYFISCTRLCRIIPGILEFLELNRDNRDTQQR
jgi:hypothetical protein